MSSRRRRAGHDRLAGAGVVRKEEADAGQGQDVPVDSVELVGQRVDLGDGDGELGVEGVGEVRPQGLHPEAEELRLAVEGVRSACDRLDLPIQLLAGDCLVVVPRRLGANGFDAHRRTVVIHAQDAQRLWPEGAFDGAAGLKLGALHGAGGL